MAESSTLISPDNVNAEIVKRQKNYSKLIVLNVKENSKPVGSDRLQYGRDQLIGKTIFKN